MFDAIEIIKNTISKNGNVLVNCAAGLTRSPAIIVLYLIMHENYSM